MVGVPARGLAVSVLTLMLLVLAGCSSSGGPQTPADGGSSGTSASPGSSSGSTPAGAPKSGGELIYIFNLPDFSQSPNIDPQLNGGTEEQNMYQGIFDVPLQQASDGSIKPGVVETWDVSADGLEYTFKIRKGIKFHDGGTLDAKAFKAMMDRARDPSNRAQTSFTYIPTHKSTEIVDDYTIKMTLSAPQSNFLTRMTRYYYGIPSPAQLEKVGQKGFGKAPVGSGPFKFQSYLPGDSAVMVKNPDYNWASPIFKHNGPPHLDKVTYRFVAEATTRIALLESGQAHVIEWTPEQDAARLAKSDKFQVVKSIFNGKSGVWYLNTQKPPTDEKAVREAMAWAIDREKLNEDVFFGQHLPAYSLITPNMWGYDENLAKKAPHFDLNRSKSVLDAAGWMPGGDGIRVKDGKRLTIEAVTYGDTRPCEFIQDSFKQAGIELKIQSLTQQGLTEAGRQGAGNAFGRQCGAAKGWSNEDPDVLRIHFDSSLIGITNQSRTNLPEVDKLLKDGLTAKFGTPERKAVYTRVQEVLMDNYSGIPTIYYHQLLGVAKEVKDLSFTVPTYVWVYDAWIDK